MDVDNLATYQINSKDVIPKVNVNVYEENISSKQVDNAGKHCDAGEGKWVKL